MKRLSILVLLLATAACGPRDMAEAIPPSKVLEFSSLYAQNCAGCHGASGRGGAAIGLANPVYLAIADDSSIAKITSSGVPGTAMPAFAQSSGGMLTDEQISAIVRGIRSRWATPEDLRGLDAPPYTEIHAGDSERGAAVYVTFCSSCHGPDGSGGARAGSIVDPSYLALVSNQGLRTTIIAGRPDLGAPDWRANVPGKPMSEQDISDIVAWLAAQRPGVMALQLAGEAR